MQSFLKNKTILILGGSGFVGKQVIVKLIEKKTRIVVLTRNPNKVKSLKVLGPPAYKFFDRDGIELRGFSIQGYMDAEKFIEHLNQIKDID